MTQNVSIHRRVHFQPVGRQKVLRQEGCGPDESRPPVPRAARLMAWAIRL